MLKLKSLVLFRFNISVFIYTNRTLTCVGLSEAISSAA